MVLPDLLQDGLDIVFCGTAAGDKSAKRNAYYADGSNIFYSTLAGCGFTPSILLPQEYPKLLTFGIGLTDLAKLAHGVDSKLKETDFDTKGFEDKILRFQPKIVCFNGKEAARIYLNRKKTKDVIIGLQNIKINHTQLFIAPSTSFNGRNHWKESYWRDLKTLIT